MEGKYNVLNKTAITNIKKDMHRNDDDDRDFEAKLQQFTNKEMSGAML